MNQNEMGAKKNSWKKYFQNGFTAFIVLAAVVLLIFFLLQLESVVNFLMKVKQILMPVIIGFVIAFLLNPALSFFEKKLFKLLSSRVKNQKRLKRLIRAVCILVVVLIALFLVGFLMYLILPELIGSITGMISEVPGQADAFLLWFNGLLKSNLWIETALKDVVTTATNYIENFFSNELFAQVKNWMEYLTSGVFGVINVLYNLLLGIVFSVYILASKERLAGQVKKLLCVFFKPASVNMLLKNARQCNQIFGAAIFGKVLDSAIVGLLCFIGMTLIGLPYAVLVSVIVGVTNVIPFFGPYIGAIPSAILILFVNPLQCLYFIIFILILQQIDCNILDPRIVGGSVGLSAFWVLLACILFGGLFGIVGLLVGVPVTACIYTISKNVMEDKLRRRGMNTNTDEYMEILYIPPIQEEITKDMDFTAVGEDQVIEQEIQSLQKPEKEKLRKQKPMNKKR